MWHFRSLVVDAGLVFSTAQVGGLDKFFGSRAVVAAASALTAWG